jgi:uncharacterized protein (DUF58 family)
VGAPPLDAQVLATVRQLEVRARRAVRSGLGGVWSSAVRGAGVEFAEVREYVVGDDARTLDWNVTARTGRLQVKRFDEEREQAVVVALDDSRSTRLAPGARPWREAAAELLLLIGLSAAEAGDRVGTLVFAETVERFIAPRHGREAVLALATRWLAEPSSARGTDVDVALRGLLDARSSRALVFVVTDGHALPSDATMARATRRHDVVFAALRPGFLCRLPERGRHRLDDPEGAGRQVVDLGSPRVRAELAARRDRAFAAAAARARRQGADWIELDADQELGRPLLEWARHRAARSRS